MALEFTHQRTKRHHILAIPDEQFQTLRVKVATCMGLLVGHFDVLGARQALEAKKNKERQEEDNLQEAGTVQPGSTSAEATPEDVDVKCNPWTTTLSTPTRTEVCAHTGISSLGRWASWRCKGRASFPSIAYSGASLTTRNRKTARRFIGAGAFGSVYLAVNLDSGSLMAVKEIKFQELSGLPNLYQQIVDELNVMEMLHHPNVVEYYGIEVHRDKVYIFEEYCQGGSLAALLVHGRIEDEGIIQVYTMQMLEGLAYLHSQISLTGVSIDRYPSRPYGVIKLVDFGAAKILAKNQRSIQRSRRSTYDGASAAPIVANLGGLGMNSLTGTPMYMSPEIIKNDKRGRHGAMDIWSLGCVVLEFATGKKPWSNLDNECAPELMEHAWMLEFREALRYYEEDTLASNGGSVSTESMPDMGYDNASVARQAAHLHDIEVDEITRESPSTSPDE
ncbi:Suppressor of Sensor Kinase (SLN1) [Salix suchowensis]|nr:Suppressor of Sensor Kinase (SLN1) [Salix suchowensis]